MPGPLSGITVLEFATMIVGPMATQYLGDLGADVIKIESPEGDLTRRIGPRRSPNMASFFLNSNRSKRSIVLDLKRPEAKPALTALVRKADVILHSVRIDAAARIGLSYKQLAAINPSIIYCHVSGYSNRGELAGRPAYDDVIQAHSGLAMLQSVAAGEPRYIPSIFADKVSALQAAMAVNAALAHQARTGEGQEINVPMFESMVAFNTIEHLWGENFQPPLGKMGYEPISSGSRRPFRTSDGHYMCVLPYTDPHWQRFARGIGDAELENDPRYKLHAARQADQPGFWAEVGRQVAKKTRAEWVKILTDADVPHAVASTLEELLSDPHLESVGFWRIEEHPSEGKLRYAPTPIEMSKTPVDGSRPAPRLGEHSEEVLSEAGIDADTIADMRKKGVLGEAA
ncbi:MAG: CaiB/BaiF CoA transferase family protein [Flavobacteriaceae bacterium]